MFSSGKFSQIVGNETSGSFSTNEILANGITYVVQYYYQVPYLIQETEKFSLMTSELRQLHWYRKIFYQLYCSWFASKWLECILANDNLRGVQESRLWASHVKGWLVFSRLIIGLFCSQRKLAPLSHCKIPNYYKPGKCDFKLPIMNKIIV